MFEVLTFVGVGLFTGFIAGLLGVGGGIISVPAMIFLLPLYGVPNAVVVHMAIATSLFLIIPTACLSTYSHHRLKAIHWSSVFHLTPGLVIGSSIGVMFALSLDRSFLQATFAIFLLLIVIRMWFGIQPNGSGLAKKYFVIPAFFIGGISSMMGVGGGTMVVPFLMWNGLSIKSAIASSSACGLPIALVGSVLYLLLPSSFSHLGMGSLIYMPAFLGLFIGAVVSTPICAKLTHKFDSAVLHYIFIGMGLIISLKLLVSNNS